MLVVRLLKSTKIQKFKVRLCSSLMGLGQVQTLEWRGVW